MPISSQPEGPDGSPDRRSSCPCESRSIGFAGDSGFTLIELLVVIALTIIIMGLVFGPLMQSFNLTRQAEVMVSAQDNARIALSLISRDLANAIDRKSTRLNSSHT